MRRREVWQKSSYWLHQYHHMVTHYLAFGSWILKSTALQQEINLRGNNMHIHSIVGKCGTGRGDLRGEKAGVPSLFPCEPIGKGSLGVEFDL